METKTFRQISKQVNVMDACYNIVKSKNLYIKICQKMNYSFSISIDKNKKRKKKVLHKRREMKKEEIMD